MPSPPSGSGAGAVVVAGGAGVRMGAGMPKALVPVGGRPLLAWCLEALGGSDRVGTIVVVAPRGHERVVGMALGDVAAVHAVVTGGETRAHSVREGLRAIPAAIEQILVHDAARPMLTPALVTAVLDALVDGVDGAIAASPLTDTVKRERADAPGQIEATVARAGLWRAETPQAFGAAALRAAYRAAADEELAAATDCAALVEAIGGRVRLVASGAPNPKVTTPADIEFVELLLARRLRG